MESELYMNGFVNFKDFKFKDDEPSDDNKNTFLTESLFLYPLYKKIDISRKKLSAIFPVSDTKVELYCKKCKSKRIFKFAIVGEEYYIKQRLISLNPSSGPYKKFEGAFDDNKYFYFVAKAECGHELIIVFEIIDQNTIMKIGQSPSIYEMNEEINNKEFLKNLDEEFSEYYTKACSLNSFDSNIGAMTYLRRIFEKLLLDCFKENESSLNITLEDFSKLRMEDKVKSLKNYLPEIIYDAGYNKIYSKISDGIHNLSEDECQKMFIPLRMAIEEIVTEKIELNRKRRRQAELSKTLQNI